MTYVPNPIKAHNWQSAKKAAAAVAVRSWSAKRELTDSTAKLMFKAMLPYLHFDSREQQNEKLEYFQYMLEDTTEDIIKDSIDLGWPEKYTLSVALDIKFQVIGDDFYLFVLEA